MPFKTDANRRAFFAKTKTRKSRIKYKRTRPKIKKSALIKRGIWNKKGGKEEEKNEGYLYSKNPPKRISDADFLGSLKPLGIESKREHEERIGKWKEHQELVGMRLSEPERKREAFEREKVLTEQKLSLEGERMKAEAEERRLKEKELDIESQKLSIRKEKPLKEMPVKTIPPLETRRGIGLGYGKRGRRRLF